MNICAITDEFGPDFERTLAHLKSRGVDHVELRKLWGKRVLKLEPSERSRALEILESFDMKIAFMASYSVVGRLPSSDAEVADALSIFQEKAERALEWGVSTLRGFFFNAPRGWSITDSVPNTQIEFVKKLADVAESAGVTVCLENEDGLCGDSPRHVLEILRGVENPHVKLLLDHGNMYRHGHDYDFAPLDKLTKWVGHVHVKDVCKKWYKGRYHCPPGEGIIPFVEYFSSLRKGGYDGFFSVETHMHARNPEKRFQNSARCLEGLLRILKESGY